MTRHTIGRRAAHDSAAQRNGGKECAPVGRRRTQTGPALDGVVCAGPATARSETLKVSWRGARARSPAMSTELVELDGEPSPDSESTPLIGRRPFLRSNRKPAMELESALFDADRVVPGDIAGRSNSSRQHSTSVHFQPVFITSQRRNRVATGIHVDHVADTLRCHQAVTGSQTRAVPSPPVATMPCGGTPPFPDRLKTTT